MNTPDRTEQTAGLRALADFLDDNPDVPIPAINSIILHRPVNVAGFVDGLDEVPVVEGSYRKGSYDDEYVDLARQFAGIRLSAMVRTEHVGAVTPIEVTAPSAVFEPFTVDEINRAARAAKEDAA